MERDDTAAMPTRVLLSDLVLGESPRWHDGRLWFCDWGAHEVRAVDDTGSSEMVLDVASFPFSIDWLPDGRLLVVHSDDRRLVRQERDGSLVTHAELVDLADHPWNEIVVDGHGNAYVNSIGFDLMSGAPPATGIIALVGPDGSARQVADDLHFPNGMAITADGSTLIVAESHANRLTAFEIEPDGGLVARRVWAELGEGAPDGICLDAEGAVWFADVPNRRSVRVREGGEVLQTIDLDRGCFACMLGGTDGQTLFMVAADWRGPAAATESRTGQVLAMRVDVRSDGRP